MPELWDLYDARRNLTGKTVRAGENLPQGSYHLMVSGWIINSKGEILMVQHHPDDGEYPMLWDCIGGWALSGEDSAKAVLREVREQSGAEVAASHGRRLQSIRSGDHFIDVWVFHLDLEIRDLRPDPDRVVGIKWVTPEIFADMFTQKRVVPAVHYFTTLYDRSMSL